MKDLFQIIYPEIQLEPTYEVGLVITCYNRPQYLHKTLSDLAKSKLDNTIVLIVDDLSDNPRTMELLWRFDLVDTPVIKVYRRRKNGCHMFENLRFAWDLLLEEFDCTYLVNLDSDVRVLPDWLQKEKALFEKELKSNGPSLVTGFNAYQKTVIATFDDHREVMTAGGVNYFFNQEVYEKAVRDSLIDLQWDDHVMTGLHANNFRLLCTKPSHVQHIGKSGLWSAYKKGVYDYALDYGSTNASLMKWRRFYFENSKKLVRFWVNLLGKWVHRLYKVQYLVRYGKLYVHKKQDPRDQVL